MRPLEIKTLKREQKMSHQIFNLRELKRAWRELRSASTQTKRLNAHRLLLVYSVECGLKAVWLKRECRTLFLSSDISNTGHDLNDVLKKLRCSHILPKSLEMSDVKNDQNSIINRKNIGIGDLHQVWRYGGDLKNPPVDNTAMEASLEKIQDWIEKELE